MVPVLELPAVYLDNVVMDAAAFGVVLINRNPTDAEIGVLVNANIALDIASLTGNAVDTANTVVTISINAATPVTMFDGGSGGFQSGFDGPESATSNPDTNTLRIVTDPTTPFSSLDTIEIAVSTQDVGATATLSTDYDYTIQDITPAVVTTAEAQDFKVVRITFDEAVKQLSASAADDALNPANYVFTPLEFPAVTPVSQSVVAISATVVDVTVDIEFSFAKQYRVIAAGIADLKGNIT